VATVRDVAQVAGVSVTTVSRVVRGERYVRPEVRQAVHAAMEGLDYRPSTLARQFREQRTRVVGCVVPDISEPFYAGILRGVEKALRPQGFIVAIHDTDERAALEADAVASLLDGRAAGLVVASSGPWPRAVRERFEREQVPVVAIDNVLEGLPVDAVYDDNEVGARLLTDHLAEHGHTRIGFVGGIPTESSGAERLAGYRSALEASGLPADERLVVTGAWRLDSARQFTLRVMHEQEPPTALVAANFVVALGVMKAARALGLRIPHDLALVSFDDEDVAELLDPPLTALRRDAEVLGATAADLLTEQLYHPEARTPREVRLPHEFVARRSCGCGGAAA
jgi:LacI family transcriptional regulator